MKNLINKDVRTERKSEDRDSPSNSSDSNVVVTDLGDRLRLDIKKSYLNSSSNFDIVKTLSLATSPLFTNSNKQLASNRIVSPTSRSTFPRVGFFVESVSHYTGGRYSTFMYAILLSQMTEVTWVTNGRPIFDNDFVAYDRERFSIQIDNHFFLQSQKKEFDVVVGTPIVGGSYALEYSKKFGSKLYSIIFESPNWISRYRQDGADADESFWKSYKEVLRASEKIIVPTQESAKYLRQWDKDFERKGVQVIPPPINELVAKQIEELKVEKDPKRLVYCTRMAPFKDPTALLKKLDKTYEVDVIGKVWAESRKQLEKLSNIKLHGALSDFNKFKLIASASAMIYPTKFEGAGMPPAEAIAMKTPVVTTDLPVLHELYDKRLRYVDKPAKFLSSVKSVVETPPDVSSVEVPEQMRMSSVSSRLRDAFDLPKIVFGVINYDCWEYLEYAIKSIYPVASKIIVVQGAVQGYPKYQQSSVFNDVEYYRQATQFDHLNKLKIYNAAKTLKDKIEMQNELASQVPDDTDYYIKLDADEIWNPATVLDAIEFMEKDPELAVLRMSFLHFWTNFKTIAKDAGGKWGTKHPRIWRWKPGLFHRDSFNFFNIAKGTPYKTPYVKEADWEGDPIYHFGWARPLEAAQRKIEYYRTRKIEQFVQDNYTGWSKLSDQTMCTQPVRSWAEEYNGPLPKILDDHPWKNSADIRKEKFAMRDHKKTLLNRETGDVHHDESDMINKDARKDFADNKSTSAKADFAPEESKPGITSATMTGFVSRPAGIEIKEAFAAFPHIVKALKESGRTYTDQVPKTFDELLAIKGIGKIAAQKILEIIL